MDPLLLVTGADFQILFFKKQNSYFLKNCYKQFAAYFPFSKKSAELRGKGFPDGVGARSFFNLKNTSCKITNSKSDVSYDYEQ